METLPEGPLGPSREFRVVRVRGETVTEESVPVATEVPLTIVANEREIATLACSPNHLRELVTGFLFTNGFIADTTELLSFCCDTQRWRAEVETTVTPDPEMLLKRLYTSGCGKGVLYPGIAQVALRTPLEDQFRVRGAELHAAMHWLLGSSPLHAATGGVHTAALSLGGRVPSIAYDDIGRHNAVDKVFGGALAARVPLAESVLLCTGRISSEILFKARRCAVPVAVSLGAPTHQSVLLARDMRVTLVGFARGKAFTVYAHPWRIVP
jgi:FdhD protein